MKNLFYWVCFDYNFEYELCFTIYDFLSTELESHQLTPDTVKDLVGRPSAVAIKN